MIARSAARDTQVHATRLLAAAVALLAVICIWSASAPAAVVTFGSSLPAPSPGYYDSCTNDCTSAQIELNGGTVRSPVTGRVVKFRIRTDAGSDPQSLRFRVLRRDGDGKFAGVDTSAAFPLSTSAGITAYTVNMPIEEGDYIGIDQPGGGVKARIIRVDDGAFQGAWFPTLADGKEPRASGNPKGSDPSRFELLLQADVDPIKGPAASTCTATGTLLATCSDPDGLPSVCGPGAIFPQCHLPVGLRTVCGGQGSGLPTCALPRNEVVACGSLGIGLGVPACGKLPREIPQVCGPTSLGFQPCSLANNLVTVCGPTGLGFQPCAFKTLIKAPRPIDPSETVGGSKPIGHESPHLSAVITCPEPAESPPQSPDSCPVTVDIEAEAEAEIASLRAYIGELSAAWRNPDLSGFESELQGYTKKELGEAKLANAGQFIDRAESWLGLEFGFAKAGNYTKRMTDETENLIIANLRRESALTGNYRKPTILYDNPGTLSAARSFAVSLRWAIGSMYLLQQKAGQGAGRSLASAGALATAEPLASAGRRLTATASAAKRPLLERRFKLRRGRRNRVSIRLPRRVVRALVRAAPKRARVAQVRLAFTFKAKPRPIVRVLDVPLRIKRKKPGG